MSDPIDPTSLLHGMRPELARRRIASFSKRFGNPHLYLAYHAAFPLTLTPDLLYRLWANFQRNIIGEKLKIPWVAVSDLLLSNLCEEVGYELYEMDLAVRFTLLSKLKDDLNFGLLRINDLSNFLLEYVQQQLNNDDPDIRDFAQVQRWMALAYIRPSEAANEFASALNLSLKQSDWTEQGRLKALIGTTLTLIDNLGVQMFEFAPLLRYIQSTRYTVRDGVKDTSVQFNNVVKQERVQEVSSPIPEQTRERSDKAQSQNQNVPKKFLISHAILEQPKAIRTVFFDAGFTLLHPNPSSSEICQRVCQQLGLHIHIDAFNQRMTEAEDYYFRQTRLKRHTWANEQSINEFWIDYYMNLLRPFVEEHDEPLLYELALRITREFDEHTSWQVYPDVFPVLEKLRAKNYILGVISDWSIALGPILRRLHLTKYFDAILVSAVTRFAKPSPALYELALQRANSIADYTIHIGDSYIHDVLGARAVGITPILLDRHQRLEESNVDCLLVNSLFELLDLLNVPQ